MFVATEEKMKKDWKKFVLNMRPSIIVLVTFVVFGAVSVNLLQTKLMENAQMMGYALAQNYSIEEQYNIMVCKTLTRLGAKHIDEQSMDKASKKEVHKWVHTYANAIKAYFGQGAVNPFLVIDGQVVAADPREDRPGMDISGEKWYQEAMASKGEVIFSDTYKKKKNNQIAITIAQRAENSDSIFAFDVFPEKFHVQDNPLKLPERSSYYLCDDDGKLLYYSTENEKHKKRMQTFASKILTGIEAGKLEAYNAVIEDMDGVKKGVYYYKMDNGWVSILLIPIRTIMGKFYYFYMILFFIFFLLLLLIIIMAVRDYRRTKEIERANDTVKVLGNSYYAIYRINYYTGTYESIKSSDYVKKHIKKEGSYEALLDVLQNIIEENAYGEFKESFSLRNIKSLVEKQVHNFGGDLQRLFGDTYKWINVRLLFDESLAPGEAVLCFREVDQEKQHQLKQLNLLENALAAAKKSEKTKSVFFSNMSHDMRTPLNGIIGFCSLAKQNLQDPEKIEEYVKKIEFSGKQLLNLINDVLEISRIEQGNLSMEYEPTDLQQCVEGCMAAFREHAQRQNKKLKVIFELEDRTVMVDAQRLGQILNNLVSNAFKYTKEGAEISVAIRQNNHRQNTNYQIMVQDTGIGMSEEFLEAIFEPYTRENRFAAGHEQSMGLGMAIVKNLVQQMNGEIVVSSKIGEGSLFTVTLPLQIVEKNEEKQERIEEEESFSLEGMRILLTEDNQVNMEIAAEILAMNRIEVVQAWNGAEAVETFHTFPSFSFDAILMDMQMPKMDGCEAARRIRESGREDAETIPIIAVTANAFAEDIALTTEAGMDAHVSKPIDFHVLCRTLEELTKQRRERESEH